MNEITSETIKRLLGLDRDNISILDEIDGAINASKSGTIFSRNGLCDGFSLTPHPDEYFIAQEFSSSGTDLRLAITKALDGVGVKSIRADDFYSSGAMLCKISALIQSTPFGLYQLSTSQNRNVYIELGIAIGLGRPFILVKDKDAQVPPILESLEYVQIDSYLELQYELKKKVETHTTTISRYALPTQANNKPNELIAFIAHGGYEGVDFSVNVAKEVHKLGFYPYILNDKNGKIRQYLKAENIPHRMIGDMGINKLDETIAALRSAIFGIYQVDKNSQPDAFLALGMALGLNKPVILTQKATESLPADLRGLSIINFNSYTELSSQLDNELVIRLKQYGITLHN